LLQLHCMDILLWVLKFLFKAHFLDHGFKANCGPSCCSWVLREQKKVMILLPWEKNFEYKFSKMLFDVFGDLSLLWHLPNQDIACKQFKIVKIPKKCLFIVLCSYNNILSRSKCAYETFVLICHHCGTGLIRILCPKRSK